MRAMFLALRVVKPLLALLLIVGLLAILGVTAQASIVLGTGTASLLGGDLTDPENDIDDSLGTGVDPYGAANYNWVNAWASVDNYMAPGAGTINEASLDIFDNKVGGGEAKFCCQAPAWWVAVEFDAPYQLTHFTATSSNDSPQRDPIEWQILGSNDSTTGADGTWVPIFDFNEAATPWTARNQVMRFDGGGVDFADPVLYTQFKIYVAATGNMTQVALGELELFGTAGDGTLTSAASGFWDVDTTWDSGEPGRVPTEQTMVVIDQFDAVTVRANDGVNPVTNVGGFLDFTDESELTIETGALLTIGNATNVGGMNTVAVNGELESDALNLAAGSSLEVAGTGIVDVNSLYVGEAPFLAAGATLEVESELVLDGSLDIDTAGATLTLGPAPDVTINAGATLTNAANLTTTNLIMAGGGLTIGAGNNVEAADSLILSGGSALDGTTIGTINAAASGTTISVTGGSSLTVDNPVSASSLTVRNSSVVAAAGGSFDVSGFFLFEDTTVDYDVSGTGSVTIEGTGTTVSLNGGLATTGALTVNGGTANVNSSSGNVEVIAITDGVLNLNQDITTSATPTRDGLEAELHADGNSGNDPYLRFEGPIGTGGRLGDVPLDTQYYNDLVNHSTFMGRFSQPGDYWQAVWTGQFVPTESGNHIFRVGRDDNPTGNTDDDGSIYVDVNRNGVFEENNTERIRTDNNGQFTATGLTAGVAYDIAIGYSETAGAENFAAYFQTPSITSWTKVNPSDAAQAGMWQIASLYGMQVSGGEANLAAVLNAPGVSVSDGALNLNSPGAALVNPLAGVAPLDVTGGVVNADVAVGGAGNLWAVSVSGSGVYNANVAASVGTEDVAVTSAGALNLNAAGAMPAGMAASAVGPAAAITVAADGAAAGSTLGASEGGGVMITAAQGAGNFPTVSLAEFGGLAGDLTGAVYEGGPGVQNVTFVENSIMGATAGSLPTRAQVLAQTGVGAGLLEAIIETDSAASPYLLGDNEVDSIFKAAAFGPWSEGRVGNDVTFEGVLQDNTPLEIGGTVVLNSMDVTINGQTRLLTNDADSGFGDPPPPYKARGIEFLGLGQLRIEGPVQTGVDGFESNIYSRTGYYDPDDGSGHNNTGESILALNHYEFIDNPDPTPDEHIYGIAANQIVRVGKGVVDVIEGNTVGGVLEIGDYGTLRLDNSDPSSGTYSMQPGSILYIDNANRLNGGATFSISGDAYVMMPNNTNTDTAGSGHGGFNNVNLIIAADTFGGGLKLGQGRLLTTPTRQGQGTNAGGTQIVAGIVDANDPWVQIGNPLVGNGDLDINSNVTLPGVDIVINDWPEVYYDLPRSENDLRLERVELNGQVNLDRGIMQFNNIEVRNGRLYIGHGDGGNPANGRNIDVQSTGTLTVFSQAEWVNIESQWTALDAKIKAGTLFPGPGGIIIENGANLDRIRYLADDVTNDVELLQEFTYRKGSSTQRSLFRLDEDGTDTNNDCVVHVRKFVLQEGAYVGIERANQDADELRISAWLENITDYDGTDDDTNTVQMDQWGNNWSYDDVGLVAGSEPMTLLLNRPGNGGTTRIYGEVGGVDDHVTIEALAGDLHFEQGSSLGPNAVVTHQAGAGAIRVYAGADGTPGLTEGTINLNSLGGIEVFVDNGTYDFGPPPVFNLVYNTIGATINIGPGLEGVDIASSVGDSAGNLGGNVVFNRISIGDGSLAELIRNGGSQMNVRDLDLGPDGRIDLNGLTLRPDSISGNGRLFDGSKVALTQGGLLDPGTSAGAITLGDPGNPGADSVDLETVNGAPGDPSFTYQWEYVWEGDGSYDVANDLIEVTGDLTIGDYWVLKIPSNPDTILEPPVWEDSEDDIALFTYTGTLTATGTGGAGVGGVLQNVTLDGTDVGWDLTGAQVVDDGAGTIVLRANIGNGAEWNVDADGDWTESAKWLDPAVPDGVTTALMAKAGRTIEVTGPSAQAAHRLLIDQGTVNVASGGSLGVTANVDVAAGAALDVAGQLNAGVINTAGTTNLASGSTGTIGKVNVSGGATTVAGGAIGEINVSDGTLDYDSTSAEMINVTGGVVNAAAGSAADTVVADPDAVATLAAPLGLTVRQQLDLGNEFTLTVADGSATAQGADLTTEVEQITLQGDVFLQSASIQPGLEGRYHSGVGSVNSVNAITWTDEPTDIVVDAQVNFPSVNDPTEFRSPLTGYVNQFGIEWVGFVEIPADGNYTFFINSDDGSTLELDGSLLINNDGDHGMREYSAVATGLSAGLVPIRMLFYEDGGGAGMIARWDPGTGPEVIPASALFHGSLVGANELPDMAVNVPTASTLSFTMAAAATLGDLDMDADLALAGAPSVSFNDIHAADGTTLAGTLVEVRGMLAPGDSIGAVTIEGDLVMADGSSLVSEISGAASDLVDVVGDLDLSAASDTLELTWLADGIDSPFGGTYRLASYTGMLDGTFTLDCDFDAYIIGDIQYGVDDDPADPDNPLGIDVELHDLLPGDVNLDGQVSIADLAIMGSAANWGTSDGSATWSTGDLNFDGNVSIADLAILGSSANWGNSLPSPGLGAPAPVPEPGTIVLLLIGLVGLLGVRRIRRA